MWIVLSKLQRRNWRAVQRTFLSIDQIENNSCFPKNEIKRSFVPKMFIKNTSKMVRDKLLMGILLFPFLLVQIWPGANHINHLHLRGYVMQIWKWNINIYYLYISYIIYMNRVTFLASELSTADELFSAVHWGLPCFLEARLFPEKTNWASTI